MMEYNKARDLIKSIQCVTTTEKVPLAEALHRVIAEDIVADMNMPPFDKSAVDGFACRREDLDHPLKVKEIIPAGKELVNGIEKGECARIMTGAKIPPGADSVVMLEDTVPAGENMIRFNGKGKISNICFRAEDVSRGDQLLRKGTMLKSYHIPVLAGMGYANPKVYRKPSAGIITTGNELVGVSETPGGSQIRNSNGPQLYAQCLSMNITATDYGIVGDTREELQSALESSVQENSVTIVSGGVSVGDFDYVPEIVKHMGFETVFHGLKVKPGKRMLFASREDKYIFGLPGNPVSTLIQFEMLVKNLLLRLQGLYKLPEMDSMILANDYPVKNSQRTSFVPVLIYSDGTVEPVEYHGSAHVFAFTQANGFMEVTAGVNEMVKGEKVNVRRL